MIGARRAIAAVLVALTAACGGTPARIELGEAALEPRAAAVIARVPLRNVGGRELLLHGVRLDCGCRLAAPLPDALAPGGGVTLAIRCRTGANMARVRAVTVISNDPERPNASLRVPLPDVRRAALEPLYLGYVALGTSVARDVALAAAGDGEREAAMPAASDPALTVEPRPPRPDGSRVVRVRFTPPAPGPFHAALTVGMADAVSVSAVAYRRVLAFPAEVTLPGDVASGAPPAIAIKSLAAAPMQITSVDLPPGLTGELQTTTPGKEFRLVLRARGRLDGGDAAIRLHTSDPDEPLVTIPVRGGDA